MTATGISIKKAFFWQTLRVYGPIALKSASAFFLTAYYTPEMAGSFALIWMALSLFAIPADNGVKRIALGEASYSEQTAQYWTYKNNRTAAFWAVLTYVAGMIWAVASSSVFYAAIAHTSAFYTWFYGKTAPLFALWHREKKFKDLATFEWTGAILGVVSAWILAVFGFPEWSLIGLFSLPPLVACVAMFLKEHAFFQQARLSPEKLPVSGSLILSEVSTALEKKLDSILLGFFAGNAVLGLYNRSYAIVHYPQQLLQTVVNPVQEAFLRGKSDGSKSELLNMALASLSVLLPLLFLIQWTAATWISFFWGNTWLSLIPFLPVLTILSAAQWITTFLDVLWINNARYTRRFYLKMVAFAGLILFGIALPLTGTRRALEILTLLYSVQAFLSITFLFRWKAAFGALLSVVILFSTAFGAAHFYPVGILKYVLICLAGLGFGTYYRSTTFALRKGPKNVSKSDL